MPFLAAEPCLDKSERLPPKTFDRAVWRSFQMLPLRERSLLKLVYQRGATHAELAGALGMSRGSLRRTLSQAVERATNPLHLEILACWTQLTPREQRLVYLHRVLGISLREIIREGLVRNEHPDGRTAAVPCMTTLRKEMRNLERKVRRLRADQGSATG